MITIEVPLGDRSYRVVVGDGAIGALPELIPARAKRAAVLTQESIGFDVDPGIEYEVFPIGQGEREKTLDTIGSLCSSFARWGLTRSDVVVGVGGGMVTDIAGFAASAYHRGVPVVHVSTTLLGQIDAAVGGKTGVNLPEGKNLVGAYWQPSGVICDTTSLLTLPPREMASGLGEMAKYHFLGGNDLDDMTLAQRVARCVEIKAEVVASDEREGGRRAILNYGHTFGHALEIAGSFDLRHGEAVAVGLIYAAELGLLLGRIDQDRVAEHRRVVADYGLATTIEEGYDADELITLMGRDKKALDGLTFVLDGDDGVEPVAGIDRDLLVAALEAVSS
ncbi:MAG: 3-dehydroquinate synthase [Actinomycetia bacterium]|nr:3-dehydroquinate synthase [Actinomycetes bacterium]MCP4958897.1 3-dehydroquinate synthase [Actinomycetes bacterium]